MKYLPHSKTAGDYIGIVLKREAWTNQITENRNWRQIWKFE